MASEHPIGERPVPRSKVGIQALVVGTLCVGAVLAALWLVEGRNKSLAIFTGIVLVCAGVGFVFGLCCMLDDARKGRFAVRDATVTISLGALLLLVAAFTELPMGQLAKGSAIGGVLAFVLGRYAFRRDSS